MSGFEIVIQSAIYDYLKVDADIAASGIQIYDDVPQAADSGLSLEFPFIMVGDDTLTDWSTDTEKGVDAVVTIHTWSRNAGKKEVKELQGLIYNALHQVDLPSNPAFKVVVCVMIQSDTILDPDGITRHGIQKFKLLVEKL